MNGKPFTPEEIEKLKALYPDTKTADLAAILKRPITAIYHKAAALGVKKSEAFMASDLAGRIQRGKTLNTATQFKKGQVPFNKGKKQSEYMTAESIEKTKAGQFKKGKVPHNTRSDFEVSVRRKRNTPEVYMHIRVAKGKWELYHRFVWMQAYGQIPAGKVVTFKNGNSLDCRLENLELITLAENAIRNSASINLADGYVANCLAWRNKEMQQHILKNHPELIQAAKLTYQLNRKIKSYGN